MFNKKHLALLTDFYELTMGRGYFHSDMRDRIAYFDVFFRQNPDSGGYSIVCGLERICRYLQNLCFEEDDIEYLRSKKVFDEEFLDYLKTFRFTGDVWAIPEGSVIFPGEPILTVRAPVIEAQLVETYILLTLKMCIRDSRRPLHFIRRLRPCLRSQARRKCRRFRRSRTPARNRCRR